MQLRSRIRPHGRCMTRKTPDMGVPSGCAPLPQLWRPMPSGKSTWAMAMSSAAGLRWTHWMPVSTINFPALGENVPDCFVSCFAHPNQLRHERLQFGSTAIGLGRDDAEQRTRHHARYGLGSPRSFRHPTPKPYNPYALQGFCSQPSP